MGGDLYSSFRPTKASRITYLPELISFQLIIWSYLQAAVEHFAKSNKNALGRKFKLVHSAWKKKKRNLVFSPFLKLEKSGSDFILSSIWCTCQPGQNCVCLHVVLKIETFMSIYTISTRGLAAPLSIPIASGSTLKTDLLEGLQLSLKRAALSSAFKEPLKYTILCSHFMN